MRKKRAKESTLLRLDHPKSACESRLHVCLVLFYVAEGLPLVIIVGKHSPGAGPPTFIQDKTMTLYDREEFF